MEVYWYTKKEYSEKLYGKVEDDFDNDYYLPIDECTYVFQSADECLKAIRILFPMATFSLSFDMNYNCGQVCNFDDHLWELKEYRDELNLKTIRTSI